MMLKTTALLLALLGFFGLAHAQGVPAHYLVFEVPQGATPRLVHQRIVTLQQAPEDRVIEKTQVVQLAQNAFVYRLRRGGVDLGWREAREPTLRAEFARQPGIDDSIVAHAVEARTRVYVLRVPVALADEIAFGDPNAPTTLALEATMPVGRVAGPQAATLGAIGAQGPSDNRVDVLVVAEGYRAEEESRFVSDAANLNGAFFQVSPYLEYENFVNWTTLFVPSRESGATHPPYRAGCSTDLECCADPDAQKDPRAGQRADNAFGARFCTSQIHRLVTVDMARLYAAAAAAPDWDEILVIVNDPVYGGAGGSISVSTTHRFAADIVLHEYAHSFSGLADEYDSLYPGYPACSDTGGTRPCQANVTDETRRERIKWASWLTPGIAIPTPSGTPGVGLFEGARYQTSGMYRPTFDQCMMRYLDRPFCAVCREQYVRVLYRGGWGTPLAGISLIEPRSAVPDAGAVVAHPRGATRDYAVTLLAPNVGALAVEWWLDGARLAGQATDRLPLRLDAAEGSRHTLEVRVSDTTSMLAASTRGTLGSSRLAWTIEIAGDEIFANGFD